MVYPGLATPANPRLNPRGAYYENLIVHSPVKLQGVGPGSAGRRPVQRLDHRRQRLRWRHRPGRRLARRRSTRLTWVGNQTVYEGAVDLRLRGDDDASTASAFRAGIDGFDVRGGDQSGFPGNINADRRRPDRAARPTRSPRAAASSPTPTPATCRSRTTSIESNGGAYGAASGSARRTCPQPDTNQHNENIRIANNRIVTNGGTNLAGGIGLFAGSDGYDVTGNDICGNFSAEYGGGVSVYGLQPERVDRPQPDLLQQLLRRGWRDHDRRRAAGRPARSSRPARAPWTSTTTWSRRNLANDDGGGIRFLMAGNFPMNVYNNMIVNNVSTHEGGGIALDDAPNVRVYNNTIMKNITTATAVTSNGRAGCRRASRRAPTAPCCRRRCRAARRSSATRSCSTTSSGTTGPAPAAGGTVIGIGLAGRRRRRSTTGTSGVADGSGSLARPTRSCSPGADHRRTRRARPTSSTNPSVVDEFDLSVLVLARGGPTPTSSAPSSSPSTHPPGTLGDYHIAGASPAVNAGAASKGGVNAPAWDIDNDGRPNGAASTCGADEMPGSPVPRYALGPAAAAGPPAAATCYRSHARTSGPSQEAYLTFTQVGRRGRHQAGPDPQADGQRERRPTQRVADRGRLRPRRRRRAGQDQGIGRRHSSTARSFPARASPPATSSGRRALADGTITVFRNGVQVGERGRDRPATWAGASGGGQIGVRFTGTGNPRQRRALRRLRRGDPPVTRRSPIRPPRPPSPRERTS